MKKLYTLMLVVLALAMVFAFAACSNNEAGDVVEDVTNEAGEVVDEVVDEVTGAADELDLSVIDTEVAYGDYAAMEALSKEIQNLQAEGKVVKIDGDFEKLGSNWSIMEANGEGQSIGTTVKLLSGDYPEGDCRAVVTGVVVNDGLSAYITTTADNITIVE